MPPQKPQAARGRPRKLTDDAVVDGAIELIATDGFAALSTRSLAERLGIRSSMLYTYFESLDEIAEAVKFLINGWFYNHILIADFAYVPSVRAASDLPRQPD